MRTDEEIIADIEKYLESHVQPAVDFHGGQIKFLNYENGHVILEMGGACSGCAASTQTLKMGVENILKTFIPEIETIEGVDDPFSTSQPFFTYQYAQSPEDE